MNTTKITGMSWKEKADEFLETASLYHLGKLPTEQFHPLTNNLSELSKSNLTKAISVLKEVDASVFKTLNQSSKGINQLRTDIEKCLSQNGTVFLCGCGATGRLSLTLDFIWNEIYPDKMGKIKSFMSGGDIALVHSIEGFEDFPEYGARHLRDLNFKENDLLISCTEGGETPYVIGATEEASKISKFNPYFLYCNPDHELIQNVERSKKVIGNSKINKINLTVGPMALSGSTRMQASSVLFLCVGLALFYKKDEWEQKLQLFENIYEKLDHNFLEDFIKAESEIYLNNDFLIYEVDEFAISVFTDTTERAPTFNMRAFERDQEVRDPNLDCSLCYVKIKNQRSKSEAWNSLLNRDPHCLNWVEESHMTTVNYLNAFDFSEATTHKRKHRTKKENKIFEILDGENLIHWSLNSFTYDLEKTKLGPFFDHALLKMCLNIHSTLLMGRLERYEQNIMTWVNPTNGKLIDRSVRYIIKLLEGKKEVSYNDVAYALFKNLETLSTDESIVLKTVESLCELK